MVFFSLLSLLLGLLRCRGEEDYFSALEGVFEESCKSSSSSVLLESSLDQAALAVAREFLDEKSCREEYQLLDESDAYGAFRSAAEAAAGVEKAIALAIVLLVVEHGAAPFDDPEIVELCRSLDRSSRDSLVTSLEDYFGDFYATAALELGSLRFSLLEERDGKIDFGKKSKDDELLGAEDHVVELWIDVLFFLVVFGVACALSATLRKFYRLAASSGPSPAQISSKTPKRRTRPRTKAAHGSAPLLVVLPSPSDNNNNARSSTRRRRATSSTHSEEHHPDALGHPNKAAAASSSSNDESSSSSSSSDEELVPVVPAVLSSSSSSSTSAAAAARSSGSSSQQQQQQRQQQRWKKRRERKTARGVVEEAPVVPATKLKAVEKTAKPVAVAAPAPAPTSSSGRSKAQATTSAKVDRRSFAEAALGHAPPPAACVPNASASVKVVPLPPSVDDAELGSRFARYYGGVLGARVFRDADPPHGYVDFDCRANAVAAAFDANGKSLFGDGDDRVACVVRERAMSAELSDHSNRRLF